MPVSFSPIDPPSEWTITELKGNNQTQLDGEVFTWNSSPDVDPSTSSRGGRRCAPKAPWSLSGAQQFKRTDYPGSSTPSIQVLGPRKKPFTLEGAFDDRYNFPGFAVSEFRRLEAMLERGNLCRIQFQDQVFIGLFSEWTFPYRRAWQIGYSITFDVHDRTENFSISNRSPETNTQNASTSTHFDNVDTATQATLDKDTIAPRSLMGGSIGAAVTSSLSSLANNVDALGSTIDNRELTPPESPVDGFTRIATQFRTVQQSAADLIVDLIDARSDLTMSAQTVTGVLDFEDWSRSLRYNARVLMGSARAGDKACTAQASPDITRLYRPRAGESLYAIARNFLGSPDAWRLLYDRNNLVSVTMSGSEILAIPSRDQV